MTTAGIQPADLRTVLGRVPTGVMIITTRTEHGQDGRTANSFTSVSLQPPLVSVCFSHTSRFLESLRRTRLWGVSVLAADQRQLPGRFAARGIRHRLDDVPHVIGAHSGAALLCDAVATLECRTVLTQQAGDHMLLIGEVLALHPGRETAALVFYCGDYHGACHPAHP